MAQSSFLDIEVWFCTPSGKRLKAGNLAIDARSPHDFDSQFRHSGIRGVPLLAPNAATGEGKLCEGGLPLFFEDMLPDAWGRALIARAYGIAPNKVTSLSIISCLAKGRFDLIGAISLSSQSGGLVNQESIPQGANLNTLVQNVWQAEDGLLKDAATLIQMARLTGSGGARPKFLYSAPSGDWLIKPSSKEDFFDIIRGEMVCLKLANDFGVDAPEAHLLIASRLGQDRPVIKIRRFDTASNGGRYHLVSMKTFLGAKVAQSGSYEDIFDVIKKHSSHPAIDCERLLRQLLLNVAVGNIDDHLKNFSMIWRESGNEAGWRLSPAYDITPAAMENPDAARYQSISICRDDEGEIPTWATLVRIAAAAGVSEGRLAHLCNELTGPLSEIGSRSMAVGMKEGQAKDWQRFSMDRLDHMTTKASATASYQRKP